MNAMVNIPPQTVVPGQPGSVSAAAQNAIHAWVSAQSNVIRGERTEPRFVFVYITDEVPNADGLLLGRVRQRDAGGSGSAAAWYGPSSVNEVWIEWADTTDTFGTGANLRQQALPARLTQTWAGVRVGLLSSTRNGGGSPEILPLVTLIPDRQERFVGRIQSYSASAYGTVGSWDYVVRGYTKSAAGYAWVTGGPAGDVTAYNLHEQDVTIGAAIYRLPVSVGKLVTVIRVQLADGTFEYWFEAHQTHLTTSGSTGVGGLAMMTSSGGTGTITWAFAIVSGEGRWTPTVTGTVSSGDLSLTSAANKVPQADGLGNIDPAWLIDASGATAGKVSTAAQTFAGKKTMTPTATNAGLNVGSLAGDPSSPAVGDIHYNSNVGRYKIYR